MSVNRWRHCGSDNYGTTYQCLKCYEKWYGTGPSVWNTQWKYCPYCATQWDAEQVKSKRMEVLDNFHYNQNYYKPVFYWVIEKRELNWWGSTIFAEHNKQWEVDYAFADPCSVADVKKVFDKCKQNVELGKSWKDDSLSPMYEYRLRILTGEVPRGYVYHAEQLKNMAHLEKLFVPLEGSIAREWVNVALCGDNTAEIKQAFLMTTEYRQGDIVEFNENKEIVRLIRRFEEDES